MFMYRQVAACGSAYVDGMRPRAARLALFVAATTAALLWLAPAALAQVSFSGPTHFATGSGPAAIAVGDFDGDADPDLAVPYRLGGVSVLLGQGGGGAFGLATDFATGSLSRSVAMGDFNGDGDPDLAVGNTGSDTVSVLLGEPGGGFAPASNVAVGPQPVIQPVTQPVSVAVGDFDGDGKLDFATANQASSNVSVRLGGGDGTFVAAGNYAVGQAQSVAVGDFDGDSDADLVVANRAQDNVSVLLGNGDGTFGTATNFGADNGPVSVAVGDFDGDSDLDLAAANSNSDNVSVLLGDGDGGFGAATNFATGDFASAVAVGDFNGDADPDLAVVNAFSRSVAVLLGQAGGGGFGAATNFTVTAANVTPGAVGVGDFDGDGDIDMAVATDGVAVLLNTNLAPVAVDDSYSQYGSDTPLDVTAAGGVLANDSDPDNDPLTATLVDAPAHGTLTLDADGSFSYEPEAGFDGVDSFTYMANDGTVDSVAATVTITILKPPDTVIEAGGPADGSVTAMTSAFFNFSSPDSSGIAFECRLNDAEFATCESPIPYTGLPDGTYTFEVRAVDAAGMADASPASRTWRIDTTPPDTAIVSGPAAGSFTTATGAQFAFSGTPGDAVSFECRLDDAAGFAACSSPTLYAMLADGSHTFQVRAIDAAGNADQTPASRTWNVDTTGPTLAPTVNAGNAVYLNQAGVTASPGATDPGGSGVASAACGPISTTTAGDHTVDCTAIDNVGNTSNVTFHYTVQYKLGAFQAPAANSKYRRGQTVPIRITLTDNAGVRLTDTAAAALASGCRVTFAAAGAQTLTPKCMTYDATAHAFTYRWALAKTATGNASITVTVTYPAPSTTTTKSEPITIT